MPTARVPRTRGRIEPFLITALIACAALAHGAVERWALTAGHLAVFAALAAVMLKGLRNPDSLVLPRSPADLPAVIFLAVLALASVFSLCPRISWLELIRIAACGALFFLASLSFKRRAAVFSTAWALALFGAAFATLGLVEVTSELFGFRTFQHASGRLSLTLANPNHYAALLSMLACLTLGLATAKRGARRGFLLLCTLYLGTAVVFTASRAGMAAMVAGFTLLLGGLLLAGRRADSRAIAGAVAAIALLAVVLGPRLPVERLATLRQPLAAGQGRWQLWTATWELALQHPWTGSGLGTFQHAIAPFQPPRLADRFLQHAHNDYLELAAEAGFPALATALAVLVVFVAVAVPGLARAGAERQAVGLGAFAGIGALLVHSIADFNLHIPVNAWLLAVLAALCLSAAGVGGVYLSPSAPQGPLATTTRKRIMAMIIAVTSVLAAFAALSPYLASRRLDHSRQLAQKRHFEQARVVLEPAVRWPLADPEIHTQLGSLKLALALEAGGSAHPPETAEARRTALEAALAHHRTACRRCPVRADAFLQLAAPARLMGRFEEAEEALKHAVELAPLRAGAHYQLGGFHLSRGAENLTLASYGTALALDLRLAEGVFESLSRAGWSDERIRAGWPATASLRVALAEILDRRTEPRAATSELRRAYELEPSPAAASRHLEALANRGEYATALTLTGEYRDRFPTDEGLIRQTIAFLRRLEKLDQVPALYRRLIDLDPADPRPYASLGTLLCQNDQYREAIEVFARGEARATGTSQLSYRLGLCHRRRGRDHLALEALTRAAALEPGDKLVRYHLGEQFRRLGLEAQAMSELRACLDIDPEFGRCRNSLARLLK